MSSTKQSVETTGRILTINAPGEYANSALNGTECVVVHDAGVDKWDFVTALLLDGYAAGREWYVMRDHLEVR